MLAVGTCLLALAVGAPVAAPAGAAPDNSEYEQLDTLIDVYLKVRENYVDDVDKNMLIENALKGMLAGLDPHSSYMNAHDSENMEMQTEGKYGGLGLTVTSDEGVVRVIAPIDGTPAKRAGVKAGDFITHLDDDLIIGTALDEAVDRMRGAPGTKIKLTIARQGEKEPLTFTLVREIIKVDPVRHEARGQVGVLRIATFNRQTGRMVREGLVALRDEIGPGIAGYVVDLRSNPGGLLTEAIAVADAFLTQGEIVSQRGRNKEDILRYFAKSDDYTDGKPVVVLVDGGSASASEIVAGALKDQRRALIVGERTFGKGSVQTLIPLSDGAALRLTTARYYTPSGRSIQANGIAPDIEIPQLSDPGSASRQQIREADLRNHLMAEATTEARVAETDTRPDPRFSATPATLEKDGVKDFQLSYAVSMVERLAPAKKPAPAKPAPAKK